jgi:hypothetical protein
MEFAKKILSFFIALVVSVICVFPVTTKATEIPKKLDINSKSKNFTMSERLTYEELISRIAINEGITIEEAKEKVPPKQNTYQSLNATTSGYYREFVQVIPVDSVYQPTLHFYCETFESAGYISIQKVLHISMNRTSDVQFPGLLPLTKGFNGEVYYNLENFYTIYYLVNGDFTEQTTTTMTGGVEIGLGESTKVYFNVSSTSNIYKTYYGSNRLVLYR